MEKGAGEDQEKKVAVVLGGFLRFMPLSPHLGVLGTTEEGLDLTMTAGHVSATQIW